MSMLQNGFYALEVKQLLQNLNTVQNGLPQKSPSMRMLKRASSKSRLMSERATTWRGLKM